MASTPSKNLKTSQEEYASAKHDAFENGELHLSYKSEMHFYDLVKQGNIEELEALNPKLIVKGQGKLSDDKFRNIQYHFVIATAMIVRFCIEGGLPKEAAYTLSDVFIRRMDKMWEKEDVEKLHHEMVLTFAKTMRDLKKNSGSSLYVRKSIDYITSHYNLPIKVSDISDYLGLSEKYLSTLFKKETGQTIVSYVENVRIEEACSMLTYTELSYAEIAESLSFNSHSYFSKVFKKNKGVTPMQYRLMNQSEKFSAK
ncbi:AraC family transcriptional regulator [Treponema sp.]|uniref:helix-turn-helix transcriptional regulator n=1 Tax=Treponema sp. TaxID=166 RepID=UPI00298DAB3B|nr:AraC family transcriptional regulator [Treponema sp.]MCR5613315.1 AraC family transcriptional regulator [Treponema sp.]